MNKRYAHHTPSRQKVEAHRNHQCELQIDKDEDYKIYSGRCSCGWTGPHNLAEVDAPAKTQNHHASLAVRDIWQHEVEEGVKNKVPSLP